MKHSDSRGFFDDFHSSKTRLITGLVAAGFLLSVGYFSAVAVDTMQHQQQRCADAFTLLEPWLDCQKIQDETDRTTALENKISEYVALQESTGRATRISVFYRDLDTRKWFGVGADEEYYPASLAKLPLALSYYKVSDLDPSILNQSLTLTASAMYTNDSQRISVDSPMKIGQTYTVREMIHDMLVYSDNRQITPLTEFMRPEVWRHVYEDLGMFKPSDSVDGWNISPRTASQMFRALYNSSFLDPDSSQAVLQMLTDAKYTKGIVAGVAPGTVVAHKFGEATSLSARGEASQPVLHDCGIVYKGNKPYIICVMTEGKTFEDLENAIASISRIVYEAQ